MTAAVFVDTNVLVYARDRSEPKKRKLVREWMSYFWTTNTGRLSFQVLVEFYRTATVKLKPRPAAEVVREEVRSLLAWRPMPVDLRMIEGAWRIQERYGLSWWDALIVSAAQLSGCRYLLTEDLRENQRFGDVQVIHPFHTLPADLDLAQPRFP